MKLPCINNPPIPSLSKMALLVHLCPSNVFLIIRLHNTPHIHKKIYTNLTWIVSSVYTNILYCYALIECHGMILKYKNTIKHVAPNHWTSSMWTGFWHEGLKFPNLGMLERLKYDHTMRRSRTGFYPHEISELGLAFFFLGGGHFQVLVHMKYGVFASLNNPNLAIYFYTFQTIFL